MAVVIRDAFGDPETTRVRRPGEIPWPQLDRPQSLYVPDMKELMRDGVQCVSSYIPDRQRLTR